LPRRFKRLICPRVVLFKDDFEGRFNRLAALARRQIVA